MNEGETASPARGCRFQASWGAPSSPDHEPEQAVGVLIRSGFLREGVGGFQVRDKGTTLPLRRRQFAVGIQVVKQRVSRLDSDPVLRMAEIRFFPAELRRTL